jgi:hypothetical protein
MKTSDTINELAQALSKAQGEIKDATKSHEGYGYTYADLADILTIGRPILSKHGLSLVQFPADSPPITHGENGVQVPTVKVVTRLLHLSGQWLEDEYTMPVEQKVSNKGKATLSMAQSIGMTITYARRYAAAAVLGMAQTDNDASVVDFVTGAELKELKALIASTNSDVSKICAHCQIDQLEDISHANFVRVRDTLNRKAQKQASGQQATKGTVDRLKGAGNDKELSNLQEQMAQQASGEQPTDEG